MCERTVTLLSLVALFQDIGVLPLAKLHVREHSNAGRHVHVGVCLYVCIHVHCMCVSMYTVCVYPCMHVSMYVCVCI